MRGVRTIEREMEGHTDAVADVERGYYSAVRSALTDDGRPPLEASGRKLHIRLGAIVGSLGRAEDEGLPIELQRLNAMIPRAFEAAGGAFVPLVLASPQGVHQI